MNARINDIIPALIDSCPSDGPTTVSWIIRAGAGSLPDLRTLAKSFASWIVKLPVIEERPPSISWFTRGAE